MSDRALMNRPVEDLRREPSIHAERVSQARLGEAARVIEAAGEWSKIQLEHDGYVGWVHSQAIFLCGEHFAAAYLDECNAMISVPLAEAFDDSGALIQKIPLATLARMEPVRDARALICLPDGRAWQVKETDVTPLSMRPQPNEEGIAQTLDRMRQLCGVPYLWGGRTPYGFDCSGFAGTFYALMGVTIPRDAHPQFEAGVRVDEKPSAGDLLFFGESTVGGAKMRISHVAISLGGDEFIHANGGDWGVSCNSFNPESKNYREWLAVNYRGARRFR